MNTVDSHNLGWVRIPVTWGVSPGWAETIWSIELMAPGLVSEVFLIYPPECLPWVLHGLLSDFPNKQATQGRSFLVLLIFLGIIPLFYSMEKDLK